MYINVSIFGHILLDPELQGRFGVQGNTFRNTLGYLHQYLETQKEKSLFIPQSNLERFIPIMQQLVEREDAIRQIADITSSDNFLRVTKTIGQEILDLKVGEELVLPGGWKNSSDGHAMIYQFQKIEDNKILFSMYNAGAGIDRHHKVSFLQNERYFPVKTYEIPLPCDQKEIHALVCRLTLPQVSPTHLLRREHPLFNAQILYSYIEESVPFLHANLVDVTQKYDHKFATTAGQISGTCTQRSIHQMLKLNFDTLINYQRFILDFKMFALRDFIKTHPLPRSLQIAHFIVKGIENNLKICLEPGVFTDEQAKKQVIDELIALKKEVLAPTAITTLSPREKMTANQAFQIEPAFRFDRPTINILNASLGLGYGKSPQKLAQYPAQFQWLEPITLDELTVFYQNCQQQARHDPLWVYDQIEQLIQNLPLPEKSIPKQACTGPSLTEYFDDIAFYGVILQENKHQKMLDLLMQIQELYAHITRDVLGIQLTPRILVTQCSFVALLDYFEVKECHAYKLKGFDKPSLHQMIQNELGSYLASIKFSPYVATIDPDWDYRLQHLRNLYCNSIRFDPNQFHINYLKQLLELDPDTTKKLNAAFEEDISRKSLDSSTKEFYNKLRKDGLQGLHYALSNTILQLPQEIKKSDTLENGLVACFEPLLRGKLPKIPFNFYPYEDHNMKDILSISPLKLLAIKKQSYYRMSREKYNISDITIAKVLEAQELDIIPSFGEAQVPKITSNFIQLSSHDKSSDRAISEREYLVRELFHLRTSPAHQIDLTLDYFNLAIEKLRHRDLQCYVEANFFQNTLLQDVLKKEAAQFAQTEISTRPVGSFFRRFDRFIENGLRKFATDDGQASQASIFFIRMRFLVNDYASRYQKTSEILKNRLKDDHKHFNALMSSQSDETILASLHRYRFLTLMSVFQQNRALDELLYADIFTSYCYLRAKNNPFQQEDIASEIELQRAMMRCKTIFPKIPTHQWKLLIPPMVSSLGFDVEKFTIHGGDYPHFTLKEANNTYILDAEKGLLYKNNKTYSVIPPTLKDQPILKYLRLENVSSCFISETGNTVEFIKANSPICIEITRQGFRVQKKRMFCGKESWYELYPLSQTQARDLNLIYKNPVFANLPAILMDKEHALWLSCDSSSEALITKNDQPVHYWNSQGGQIQKLDENGSILDYSLTCQSKWHSQINTFENENFFELCLNQKGDGTVTFPRYNFSLKILDDTIQLPQTNYYLTSAEEQHFSHAAHLNFKDTEGQQLCIVAVQPFYLNPKTHQIPGEFYQLQHDNRNCIPLERLKKELDNPDLDLNAMSIYQGSARAITYKMIDGQPKPDKVGDALYLCYIYLGQHDHKRAWDILNAIDISGLDGHIDELTYLSWIIESLPVLLDENDSKATLSSPATIACQLKALSLYTKFLAQDKKILVPASKTCDLSTTNGLYQKFMLKKLQDFQDNVSNTIYRLYDKLLCIKRNLSEQFMLDDEESRSLLNYYHAQMPGKEQEPKALGALGYEWRRLNLKMLVTEKNRLKAIAQLQDDVFVQTRLSSIEAMLAKKTSVMKQCTILEEIAIDLSLPEGITINKNIFSQKNLQDFLVWKDNCIGNATQEQKIQSLQCLRSDISSDEFLPQFPYYADIAYNSGSKTPEFEQLQQFCIKYLIAHRHTPLNKQRSNIPLLCHVLYRIMDNQSYAKAQLAGYAQIPFSFLLHIVTKLPAPGPIKILQTKDIFQADQEALTNDAEIAEMLEKAIKNPVPVQTENIDESESFREFTTLNSIDAVLWQSYVSAYDTEIESYEKKLSQINASDEFSAGKLLYDSIQTQHVLARQTLKIQSIRDALYQHTQAIQTRLTSVVNEQWRRILEKANENLQQHFIAHIEAGQMHDLNEQDLLRCYFHADLTLYKELTHLDNGSIQELHNNLHRYLMLSIQKQKSTRLLNAIEQYNKHPEDTTLDDIGSVLMAENLKEARLDPTLMMFQYQENILLRPKQITALKHLLETNATSQCNESIEKVIMGGGKSKVILPLLAQKKVNGLNLVIIEVPRALLTTNHVDLNHTSRSLFAQKAHRFEFDRDSDVSAKRLEDMYHQFLHIMLNKDYLVTTGESIQSLELKYLEIIFSRPEDKKQRSEWQKQVFWSKKIKDLLKQRGDVIIDELHQGLLLKKQLNYTLGDPELIHPQLIDYSIQLYRFLDLLAEESRPNSTLPERMEQDWRQLLQTLPQQLIEHPKSPLHADMEHFKLYYDVMVKQELMDYLNDKENCICLGAANKSTKDRFAFYKEQMRILPHTLERHHKEHYGPSKNLTKSAAQRVLAIPYAANGKPNERSRFGNPLETLNYSIQSLLLDGLNEELLVVLIKQWKTHARYELQNQDNQYPTFDATPTAKGVGIYLTGTGLTLGMLDPDDKRQLQTLIKHLRYKKELLLNLLQNRILPQITTEKAILHSDAYNHVDIYRSVQGLSGTPWNHSTYHQRLRFNDRTSLGTDGYIQETLRNHKTPIHGIKFSKLDDFLTELHAKIQTNQKNLKAIIDISATLTGISNVEVAVALASFYSRQSQNDIAYILYFNEDDVLCALDVKNTQPSIVIGSTDPHVIDQKLNCTPAQRFTYYDQAHAIGTDIKQDSHSMAICLVDKNTYVQSFLQGCMRMRKLDENQRIEIVVPPEMSSLSFEALMEIMHRNELEQLKMDNFTASLAKMKNIVRKNLLERLSKIDDNDPETLHTCTVAFQNYFIEQQGSGIFEQYGSIHQQEKTHVILEAHRHSLISDWKKCIQSIGQAVDEEESLSLFNQMTSIIEKSSDICHAVSTYRSEKKDLAVEAQKEVAIEIETLKEAESYNPLYKERQHEPWTQATLASLINEPDNFCASLNTRCNFRNLLFSNNIFATDNYAMTYDGQEKMLSAYLKPVHVILFYLKDSKLNAYIINNQEADELQPLLKESTALIWLEDTQHTRLVGNQPSDLASNQDYFSLMEQIRFFGGKCNELMEQSTPFLWITENSAEKLRHLQNQIMPYREPNMQAFELLQSVLSKQNVGLDYVQEHAFDDLRNIDWERTIPNLTKPDISILQNLAQAFYQVNQEYWRKDLTIQAFQGQSECILSCGALAYLQKHIENLNQFKALWRHIEPKLLQNEQIDLTPDYKACLQTLLHLDIESLLSKFSTDRESSSNTTYQFFNIELLTALYDFLVPPCEQKTDQLMHHGKEYALAILYHEKISAASKQKILSLFFNTFDAEDWGALCDNPNSRPYVQNYVFNNSTIINALVDKISANEFVRCFLDKLTLSEQQCQKMSEIVQNQPDMLTSFLKQLFLTDAMLQLFLTESIKKEQLKLIIQQAKNFKEIIYKANNATIKTILNFDENLFEDDILQLLLNKNNNMSDEQRISIIKKAKQSETILQAINPGITRDTIDVILTEKKNLLTNDILWSLVTVTRQTTKQQSDIITQIISNISSTTNTDDTVSELTEAISKIYTQQKRFFGDKTINVIFNTLMTMDNVSNDVFSKCIQKLNKDNHDIKKSLYTYYDSTISSLKFPSQVIALEDSLQTSNPGLTDLLNSLDQLHRKCQVFLKQDKQKTMPSEHTEAAISLHLVLQHALYVWSKNNDIVQLQNSTINAIEIYQKPLEKHRGSIKVILYNIANALVIMAAAASVVGLITMAVTGKFAFFKAKTNTQETLEDIKKITEKITRNKLR